MSGNSIYFAKLPPLDQLCHVVVKATESKSDFHVQMVKSRRMLKLYHDIISAPNVQDKTLIDVVMSSGFYKSMFASLCRELDLKSLHASVPKLRVLERCILHTVKYRLSPHWNQVGRVVINNRNFLECRDKMEAVDFEVKAGDGQLTFIVKPYLVRLPPAQLEDFAICPLALEKFKEDSEYEISEMMISNEWCRVLPTMKEGQLVSVSHKIRSCESGTTSLRNYTEMREYWKSQYGYELPAESKDGIYCSVHFRAINSYNLFTYPLACLRKRSMQFMPRCDEDAIRKRFISHVRRVLKKLCGLPLSYGGSVCETVSTICSASQVKVGIPQNVRISEKKETPPRKVPTTNSSQRTEIKTVIQGPWPDDYVEKVPRKKMLLSCFPKSSDGKYMPVFCHKKTQTEQQSCVAPLKKPVLKRQKSTTTDRAIQASLSKPLSKNLYSNPAKIARPIARKPSQLSSCMSTSMNKKPKGLLVSFSVADVPSDQVALKNPSKILAQKHKFDDYFTAASTSTVKNTESRLEVKKTPQSLNRKSKGVTDSFFSSSEVFKDNDFYDKKVLKKSIKVPAQKHKFDQYFAAASISATKNTESRLEDEKTSQSRNRKSKSVTDSFSASAEVLKNNDSYEKKALKKPRNIPVQKHKFDDYFTAASTSSTKNAESLSEAQKTPQSRNRKLNNVTDSFSASAEVLKDNDSYEKKKSSKAPQKHKFDQYFTPASTSSSNNAEIRLKDPKLSCSRVGSSINRKLTGFSGSMVSSAGASKDNNSYEKNSSKEKKSGLISKQKHKFDQYFTPASTTSSTKNAESNVEDFFSEDILQFMDEYVDRLIKSGENLQRYL